MTRPFHISFFGKAPLGDGKVMVWAADIEEAMAQVKAHISIEKIIFVGDGIGL